MRTLRVPHGTLMANKLWGGRFTHDTDKTAGEFGASIDFDKKLVSHDIAGSIAHARMLGGRGIIPFEESQSIIAGLKEVLADIEAGRAQFLTEYEDIHMNVEVLLTEKIGDVAKKLHTARSRNDQVALGTKLYVKEQCAEIIAALIALNNALIKLSKTHLDTIMPAFTHLQKAQPTTLAHHFGAYIEMFLRDIGRFSDCKKRADTMPLGAGAVCATTYEIDRDQVAAELEFYDITGNSMDAVSDRDFVAEFIFSASVTMMHLSRFCEELIIWNTDEYRYITMDDAYSTGSSIMPQKKNPDMAELIRGKTGRVYGDLIAILTVLKGLPLAYNKDMQEDKEPLFDAAQTLSGCIHVFTAMICTVKFNTEVMKSSAQGGYLYATDIADYLVKRGVPFRDAHEITGKIVATCVERNIDVGDLTLAGVQYFSDKFDEDIFSAIELKKMIADRFIVGGPNSTRILERLSQVETEMSRAL